MAVTAIDSGGSDGAMVMLTFLVSSSTPITMAAAKVAAMAKTLRTTLHAVADPFSLDPAAFC